jgi:cellulose synthase/poly-beta-1,6-N-acetylglucosamine synthase-like glycosyltransferase
MNIFLATPTTRNFSYQYVSSLHATRIHGGLQWQPVVGQAIDNGRNIIVRNFLKSNCDYLLMHDSDATWHPDAIQRLVDRNLPMVSAVIFMRRLPTVPSVGHRVSHGPQGELMYSFAASVNRILDIMEREKLPEDFRNELVLDKHPDDLQEIDGCGAHFMLIRRDVLEAVRGPWFECTTASAGEDFDFCRKVKAAGFPIYCDFSVFTGHVAGDGIEIGLKEFMLFRDKAKADQVWTM